MSTEKAFPATERWSPVIREIADILRRYLEATKEPMERINFLSRIVAEEPEIDPGSSYLCDLCGLFTKGRKGKLLNDGLFVCNWCRSAEINFGIYGGEHDITPKV
jgi:hypothetical protein